VGEFELTERSGQPFRSKDMLGQVWIASFFFSECPFQCKILNQNIADLLAGELAPEPVKVVSITVDPKKDTPERLVGYAEGFTQRQKIDPERWLFVTHAQGSEAVVGAICKSRFRVPFAQALHTEKLLLIDQQGLVRGYYNAGDAADTKRLKRKIGELAAQ
jgi:cytochrome oxidase Cu insertion factor (SCO1/SenC/PrrC family)